MSYAGALWLAVQEDLYTGICNGTRENGDINRPKIIREESKGCLECFDDYFLSQCFHLSRPCLTFLLDFIKTRLKKNVFNPVSDSTSTESIILATLFFYAHGFLPSKITAKLGLNHTFAGEAVNTTSKILSELSSSFITFPASYNDRMGVAQGFKNISGIPNVVGVLGCFHVKVTPPPSELSLFLNTLGYPSVTVQMVSDVDGNLLSVEQCYPGGTREQYVWERSTICQEFVSFRHGQTWVIGGRGLPPGRHVLTPVERSQLKTSAARRFNITHSRVMTYNQHVFGCLKARFQCLNDLGTVQADALESVACIIKACCVLHNISKKFSVPLPREPVLEPVHPTQDVKGKEGEKSFYYMEETREDMIETCFGQIRDEEEKEANTEGWL
ncbi:putative nuclease HARBI1 [Hoplias malabaricus]|uniref:putative nuclease HARBI1 n=1 Tax=Hoplias malabaricus TaxID=27720 RepID=UPI003461FEC7